MTLYTHKSENVRKTWLLFAAFLVFVIGVGWIFSQIYADPSILYAAVGFNVFMNVLSFWYSDKIVLGLSRAKAATRESHRELYTIVENLAITAGLPMPKVYVVPELQPNAFATGRSAKHASVAVTEGLLRLLDRSELEGVIAHELSHIGNRDMLLSTAAVVLVGFVAMVSDFFMRSLWFGGANRNEEGSSRSSLFAVLGIVSAVIAPIAASLIQLAISRKREFLADASGALLTRYPEGLAAALEKISADRTPMQAAARTATAHLWFASPIRRRGAGAPWYAKLFMTHPPVGERVRALRGMEI